jgi:hypothetical protein
VRSAATGVPIIGGALNKLDAATNAALAPVLNPLFDKKDQLTEPTFGERYEHAKRVQEGMDKSFETAHPVLDTTAKLVGGTASLGGVAARVPGAASALGLTGKTLAARAGAGALSGAAIGGGDAAVRGEDIATGAGLGGGVGLAAPAIGRGRLIVMIYGGLALHPRLGVESLTLILLHEVGHHLAKGCRSRRDPSLACECASDYWAVTVGTDTLLQKSGRRLRMRVALEELNQVMSPGQPSKDRYTTRTSTSGCWSRAWFLRSRALFERTRPPTIEGCCITYI